MVLGSGMSNFRVIARELIEAGAVVRVDSAEQLVTMALSVLTEPGRREQLALAAEAWHARNAGAVARTLAIVQTELARRPVA
jgi:3-deoxy-D-manno-octulosonic-acid transferase